MISTLSSPETKNETKRGMLCSPRLKALVIILCIAAGISLAIAIVLAYTEMASTDVIQTVKAGASPGCGTAAGATAAGASPGGIYTTGHGVRQ